jgi:His/Glu/Gln/Arg/opine family amino acid ABC transporter permease subunit
MRYQWHFQVILDNLPVLIAGIQLTVAVSALSMAIAIVAGMAVALARLSSHRALRWAAYAYTEFFRDTPLLMQVIWVFYALPLLTGINLSRFAAGTLAVSSNLTAFLAEIYRAGITSVSRGQEEAALAIGMRRSQVYRRIILPQAVTRVIPPLGSMWVSLFKDTSILSVIAVAELMYKARLVAVDTFRPLEIYTAVAVIYYLLAYPQSLGVNYLYGRFRVRE